MTQYLRDPGLRDTSLERERGRARFLILAVAEPYESADDREAARATRQGSSLGHWRGDRAPLAEQEPWRSQIEVSLPVRPGPVSSGQDRREGLRDERSDYQRMPSLSQFAP